MGEVADIGSRISTIRSRAWAFIRNIGRYHKLVVFLLLYFLASVFYQAVCPYVPLRIPVFSQICGKAYWLESTKIPFGFYPTLIEYKLGIHYPRVVSLADGGAGRPITVWLWRTTPTAEPPGTVFEVTFRVEGDGLIFTDEKGNEIAPVLSVPVGDDEARAPRRTIYVLRKPGAAASARVSLFVEVESTDTGAILLGMPIIVESESSFAAWVRRVLDFVLGTWTFAGLSAVLALIKFWLDERERKRQEQRHLGEQIEKLYGLPASQIGGVYLDLWRRIHKHYESLELLLSIAWQDVWSRYPYKPWLFQFRKQLAGLIEKGKFSEARERLKEAKEARLWAESELDEEAIVEFIELLKKPNEYKPKEILQRALRGFTVLGLASAPSAVRVLRSLKEEQRLKELLRQNWYEVKESDGTKPSAAGRYLLYSVIENYDVPEELRKDVRQWLQSWIKDNPAPPRSLGGPCLLWPESPPALSPEHRKMLEYLGTQLQKAHSHTPFGPLKAEEDPRLPPLLLAKNGDEVGGFFWDKHPLWNEVLSSRSAVFVAPPGSGRTAFIWVGRHYRRFWGKKPALSLYLMLNVDFSEERLFDEFYNALFAALLCTLAEDPFWFLRAPESAREAITAFLLDRAGGARNLLRRLAVCGLDGTDPADQDARLLWEALLQYSPPASGIIMDRKECLSLLEQISRLLAEATRFRRGEPFAVFIWGDIKGQAEQQAWLRALWDWEELRQRAILKLFIDSEPEDQITPVFTLHWETSWLKEMLKHRLYKAGLAKPALWQEIIEIAIKGEAPGDWDAESWRQLFKEIEPQRHLDSLLDWLVAQANGCPARAIHQGNLIMEAFGSLIRQNQQEEGG